MKKIISLSFLICMLGLIFQSCTKQSRVQNDTISTPVQTINAAVSANSAYSLNVNNLGSISISKQAAHFTVSETETDPKDGVLLYKYIPQIDYSGTDQVQLLASKTTYSNESGCSGGGGRTITSNSNIVIKFTVTK